MDEWNVAAVMMASAFFGVLAGAIVAGSVIALVPVFGERVPVQRLAAGFGWLIFFSWPGVFVGLVAGMFLCWRAQTVSTLARLTIECAFLTAFLAAAATQAVVPIAWNLPRFSITVIVITEAAGLAALWTWLLKKLLLTVRPGSSAS